MKQLVIALVTVVGIGVTGCSGPSGKKLDSATQGSIKIAVDESLRPLLDAEVSAFEGIYTQASVEPIFVSEAEAVELLLADSVRLAIITRELTAEEKEALHKQGGIKATSEKVAKEGIALIVNRQSMDTLWDMTKVKNVLGGTEKVNKQVVFDHQNSGIIRVVRDSVLQIAEMPKSSFAVETNEAVIDHVSKTPDAVGLIGVSWISDSDDSVANRFVQSIRVVAIENGGEHYKPYQAYIALKKYPLTRFVVINSREARAGLGTGFTRFVSSDKGQRVVLKAGLVPVTMPMRLVQISKEAL